MPYRDSSKHKTNLELEDGCSKTFTLALAVLLSEGDAEVTNIGIVELVLPADSALLPVLIILGKFLLIPVSALDVGFTVSTVLGLHINLAKVRVLVQVPA